MSFVAVGVRDDALVAYVDRGGLAHYDELPYGTADKKAHIVGQMFVVLAGRRPRPAVGPHPPRGCGAEAAARTSSQGEAAASVIDALPLHGNALVGDASGDVGAGIDGGRYAAGVMRRVGRR